jgi:hypothetical protein
MSDKKKNLKRRSFGRYLYPKQSSSKSGILSWKVMLDIIEAEPSHIVHGSRVFDLDLYNT